MPPADGAKAAGDCHDKTAEKKKDAATSTGNKVKHTGDENKKEGR